MAEVKWIKLSTGMFDDEKIKLIESMPDADSLLVIWIKLLSQAGKTNASGYIYITENFPYTDEMLATIFNRPLQTVRLALQTFHHFGMIEIDDNEFISIANWEKHQNEEGLAKIREQNRKRVAKHRAKHDSGKADEVVTLPVTLRNATELELELDIEKKEHVTPTKKTVVDETSDGYILALYLIEKIRLNNPDFKQPNMKTWSDDFRKIIDIDKRDKNEISRLIKWVQQDDFECSNVLSPSKMRKRYDQLVMKMRKDIGANPTITANNQVYKDLGGREY